MTPSREACVEPDRKIRVFVSFDPEHDGDLLALLHAQAARSDAAFEIVGSSAPRLRDDLADLTMHEQIRQADQVIVLCGEHSDQSGRMGAELRVAQEEDRVCLLLWGRRAPMCKRPATAQPGQSMYSWTWEILQEQLRTARRLAASDPPVAAPAVSAG